MFQMASPTASWLDRSALTLSGLCLVHCLAGSVLLAVASVGGGFFSHRVHAVGLALALPLAVFALWRGVQLHGRCAILVLGSGGVGLMAASLAVGHGGSETLLSITGVTLLAAAHLLNLRWSRLHAQ